MQNKVADGREISMDRVIKTMSPPGFKPTPGEPRAGWLSTIVPQRCVHYPCICPPTFKVSY